MKIKVNDNVLVIAGKDKGKTGKVLKTLRNEEKVVVEGVNISKTKKYELVEVIQKAVVL